MTKPSFDTLTHSSHPYTPHTDTEDDRTRVSQLVQQLHSEQLITSEDFVQVPIHLHIFTLHTPSQAVGRVLSSAGDYETSLPQYKMYLAGFIARAIAHVSV